MRTWRLRACGSAGEAARRLRCATGVFAPLAAGPALATEPVAIEKLAWLSGCWVPESGEPGSGEHWLPLAGGTLLGVSRTVEHEFMQIRAGDDGRIGFIAQPSAQKTTRFPVTRLAEGEVVFENPEHDFPQRIIYRQVAGERLLARIEGRRGGAPRAVDFPMRRASCDALLAAPPAAAREPSADKVRSQ